ncbi:purine-cytosine permease family protein [Streptomyces sp. NPDC003236]
MTTTEERAGGLQDLEEDLRPLPASGRNARISGQFWIWAGANIAPINWVLGALGVTMGLGLWDTMTVLVLGNLVGMAVFGFFVLLGQRTGATGMVIGRAVFGRRGNYLPTAVQAVVVVGWCAVNTWIVLDLVVALLGRIGALDPHAGNTAVKIVVAALVMAVQVAVSLAGYRAIAAFERWTVPPTLAVLALMSVFAWFFLHIDWGYAGPAGGALTGTARISAMSIVMTAIGIGWGITWFTYAGDYARFVSPAASRRKLYGASVAGQIIPVVWLGLLGATLATKNGSVDPGQLIVDNYGGLAIPVLLLVLHGPVATNVLNIYSFSMAAQTLDIRAGRRPLTIAVGAVAFVACVFFVLQDDIAGVLDAWLAGLVGWVAPWAAIVLVHYGVVERKVTSFDHLFDAVGSRRLPDVRWRAILAFGVGVLCTWLFMDGSVAALRGPLSLRLHGIDLSWLAGALSAGALYALLAVSDGRRWVRRRESADALPHPGAADTERLQT